MVYPFCFGAIIPLVATSGSGWRPVVESVSWFEGAIFFPEPIKKADVVEHREVFDHVGLLVNKPPGMAGVPFI
jgi:hypothetical protein